MLRGLALALAFSGCLIFGLALGACDSDGAGGPLTRCDFGFTVTNQGGKDFGEACSANSECRYGTCLMPGATGNLTNDVFGFCTRGCDCDNAVASRLEGDDRDNFSCLYPPGSQGSKHHVVLQCGAVSDCAAVDPRWNVCQTPSSGGARPVCQARP